MNNLKENLLQIFTFNVTGSCFITLKMWKWGQASQVHIII